LIKARQSARRGNFRWKEETQNVIFRESIFAKAMPEQSVIVWDLETVPDLAAAARLFDLEGAIEAQVREALGTGFPKHPLHKIACIGALVASRQPEGWRVRLQMVWDNLSCLGTEALAHWS